MAELDEIRDSAETVADGITALVAVSDEGLKGAQAGLNRIATGVDGLAGVIPDIGAAIGAAIGPALRETLAPVQGIQGLKGDKGDQGLKGADGKDGRNGTDGRDGIDGRDGVDGKDGRGIKGDKGDRGSDGADAPTPDRVVGLYDFQMRLEAAEVHLDDGTVRRMQARRGPNGRITEFVRVPA